MVVRSFHDLLERVRVLRALLPQDLVHVAGGAVDDAWLRDPVRAAAALDTRALTRLVGREAALFHRLLTQLQAHVDEVGFAAVYCHRAGAAGRRVAESAAELRLLMTAAHLLIALRREVLHLHLRRVGHRVLHSVRHRRDFGHGSTGASHVLI